MSYPATGSLDALKKAGVKTICRYYSRPTDNSGCSPRGKILSASELKAIEKAGMSVVVVFQYCNRCSGFGGRVEEENAAERYVRNKGQKDAEAAVNMAREMKQPKDTPIYFGVDFDPIRNQDCAVDAGVIDLRVIAYFQEVNATVKSQGWKVGVYGAGHICELAASRILLANRFN